MNLHDCKVCGHIVTTKEAAKDKYDMIYDDYIFVCSRCPKCKGDFTIRMLSPARYDEYDKIKIKAFKETREGKNAKIKDSKKIR